MTLDLSWLTLLVSTLLPFLVAIVTHRVTDSTVKGILLAVCATATAAAQQAINGHGVVDEATAVLAVEVFFVSVGSYFGLTKEVVKKVGAKTDDAGVGVTIAPKDEVQ